MNSIRIKKQTTCAIAAICFFLSINHCSADSIVFDNGVGGATGISGAVISDSNAATPTVVADDASVLVTTVLTGIEWSGVYLGAGGSLPVDDFTIEIFDDLNGSPSNNIASFAVGNNVNRTLAAGGGGIPDIFSYSAAIDFELDPNTTYWFSIFNNTAGLGDFGIGTDFPPGSGNNHIALVGGPFTLQGANVDFRLRGTAIPEPITSSLLLPLAVFCLTRRRNK